MDKKLIKAILLLTMMIGLYLINNSLQSSYASKLSSFFTMEENNILKIIISSNQDAIELMRTDSSWVISGNDTLIVKENVIKNLFNKMQELEQQHLVTSKKDNWENYGVTDIGGTHLAFINLDGKTIAYYVFGQSTEEYNRCYVRTDQNSDVYLLNSNILYQLQVAPSFWGTKLETE